MSKYERLDEVEIKVNENDVSLNDIKESLFDLEDRERVRRDSIEREKEVEGFDVQETNSGKSREQVQQDAKQW